MNERRASSISTTTALPRTRAPPTRSTSSPTSSASGIGRSSATNVIMLTGRRLRRAAADQPAHAGAGDVPLPLRLHRAAWPAPRPASREPQATFSTCFGAPFMPRHPPVYAKMLRRPHRRARRLLLAGQHRLERRRLRHGRAHLHRPHPRPRCTPRSTAPLKRAPMRHGPCLRFAGAGGLPGRAARGAAAARTPGATSAPMTRRRRRSRAASKRTSRNSPVPSTKACAPPGSTPRPERPVALASGRLVRSPSEETGGSPSCRAPPPAPAGS